MTIQKMSDGSFRIKDAAPKMSVSTIRGKINDDPTVKGQLVTLNAAIKQINEAALKLAKSGANGAGKKYIPLLYKAREGLTSERDKLLGK